MDNQIPLFDRTVADRFKQFDQDNPKVYELFKHHVQKAIEAGKEKTSSKMIINLIRWHYYLETTSEDEFKINDRYTSHYSRKFVKEFPEHKNMFEFRTMRKT